MQFLNQIKIPRLKISLFGILAGQIVELQQAVGPPPRPGRFLPTNFQSPSRIAALRSCAEISVQGSSGWLRNAGVRLRPAEDHLSSGCFAPVISTQEAMVSMTCATCGRHSPFPVKRAGQWAEKEGAACRDYPLFQKMLLSTKMWRPCSRSGTHANPPAANHQDEGPSAWPRPAAASYGAPLSSTVRVSPWSFQ